MPETKAGITEQIVTAIIDEVSSESNQLRERLSSDVKKQLDAYRDAKMAQVTLRIDKVRNEVAKKQRTLNSSMQFENNRKLHHQRNELLTELRTDGLSRVKAFLESPDYAAFLTKAIAKVQNVIGAQAATFIVREEDRHFFPKTVNLEVAALPLGGFRCIGEGIEFDYTLTTLYDDAVKRFIDESKIGMEG